MVYQARVASRPTEGNTLYFTEEDEHWWLFKARTTVEDPEPGYGIEEHFAAQDFDLTPPDDFAVQHTAELSFGGDLMPIVSYLDESVNHLWDDVADFYFGPSLVVANLESPLTPSRTADYSVWPPQLTNNTWWFDVFRRRGTGINIYSTANNHAYDMGCDGLIETLDVLESAGVTQVGSARSSKERDDIPLIEHDGIRFAFIAWTFGINNNENPLDEEWRVNHLRLNTLNPDLTRIEADVRLARKKGADIVVALLHWSLEFELWPLNRIIQTGHRLIEAGIDIIAGNHPHSIQPVEVHRYRDANGNQRLGIIHYANGNLVAAFDGATNQRLALLSKVSVSKGESNGHTTTLVTGLELLPTYSWFRWQGEDQVLSDLRVFRIRELAKAIEEGSALPVALTPQETSDVLHLNRVAQRVLPLAYRG
ncbi:MAG: CapA family protein [Coriobacteriales bacterium]|jgi:poly-gamma-glutamate synthesis protein (capsule biosynthesis protein)|nr:CapA family protein [Coriobacteriales bacterium]